MCRALQSPAVLRQRPEGPPLTCNGSVVHEFGDASGLCGRMVESGAGDLSLSLLPCVRHDVLGPHGSRHGDHDAHAVVRSGGAIINSGFGLLTQRPLLVLSNVALAPCLYLQFCVTASIAPVEMGEGRSHVAPTLT